MGKSEDTMAQLEAAGYKRYFPRIEAKAHPAKLLTGFVSLEGFRHPVHGVRLYVGPRGGLTDHWGKRVSLRVAIAAPDKLPRAPD